MGNTAQIRLLCFRCAALNPIFQRLQFGCWTAGAMEPINFLGLVLLPSYLLALVRSLLLSAGLVNRCSLLDTLMVLLKFEKGVCRTFQVSPPDVAMG